MRDWIGQMDGLAMDAKRAGLGRGIVGAPGTAALADHDGDVNVTESIETPMDGAGQSTEMPEAKRVCSGEARPEEPAQCMGLCARQRSTPLKPWL